MKCCFICMFIGALAVLVVGNNENDIKEPHKDRYTLHPQCLQALQKQVDEEMHASLAYMNMAAHFDQNNVARKGFYKFFSENSKEEKEHAQKLIDYINRRGGKFAQFNIKMPSKTSWDSALSALNDALTLENHVNNKLYHLHEVAEKSCNDPHLMDFIESEYLEEQVHSIDNLKRYIAILYSMDNGMGEYLLDEKLQEKVEL